MFGAIGGELLLESRLLPLRKFGSAQFPEPRHAVLPGLVQSLELRTTADFAGAAKEIQRPVFAYDAKSCGDCGVKILVVDLADMVG